QASTGRHALMRQLKLGEASVKTLINRLKKAGLVETSRPQGTRLTEAGRGLVVRLKEFIKLIPNVELSEVCRDCRVSGVIFSGGYSYLVKVGGVIVFRDLVVKEGADGALIVVCLSGGLYLPTPIGVEEARVEVLDRLAESYGVKNGDLLLLGMCYGADGDRCLSAVVNTIVKIAGRSRNVK
ncbi:MAG: DUF4443 domain-containing protein, partial [Zestosphaera sp.]